MKTNPKTAILGLGITGKAITEYFLNKNHTVYIFEDNYNQKAVNYVLNHDKKDNINLILNPKFAFDFDIFEAVLISPSFKINKNYIISKNNYKNFYTELDFFYPFIKNREIFCITGTNGKTSTATVTAELLKTHGRKVFLGGNIGNPIVNSLNDDYDTMVLELSSYQLFYTKNFKCDYSILLNLKPDHLKWHKDIYEYAQSKLKLIYFTEKNSYLHTDFQKFLSQNKKIPSNVIYFNENTIINFKKEKINKEKRAFWVNLIPVIKIMQSLNLNNEKIIAALNNTQNVKYRMTPRKINTNIFINDSKATNPDSTLFALKNYDNVILILGGDDKQLDYNDFIKKLKSANIKEILIFGGLQRLYKELSFKNKKKFNTLRDIFIYLKEKNIKNETILFSPSSSSFDLYDNYIKRGEDFDSLTGEFFES